MADDDGEIYVDASYLYMIQIPESSTRVYAIHSEHMLNQSLRELYLGAKVVAIDMKLSEFHGDDACVFFLGAGDSVYSVHLTEFTLMQGAVHCTYGVRSFAEPS